MNRYFTFRYKFLEKPGMPITEHEVTGWILEEDDETVKVKFYRDGDPEIKVFNKDQGIVHNYLLF